MSEDDRWQLGEAIHELRIFLARQRQRGEPTEYTGKEIARLRRELHGLPEEPADLFR